MLRCTLYSCDAAVWLVPLTAYATLEVPVIIASGRTSALLSPYFGEPLLLLPVVPALYTSYRLWAAYRWYLRFAHPAATVVASQLIVLLVVLVAIANWRMLWGWL